MSESLEDTVRELVRQNYELSAEVRVLTHQLSQLSNQVDKFSSGINRGLWTLGGVVLVAIGTWIVGGGLTR